MTWSRCPTTGTKKANTVRLTSCTSAECMTVSGAEDTGSGTGRSGRGSSRRLEDILAHNRPDRAGGAQGLELYRSSRWGWT